MTSIERTAYPRFPKQMSHIERDKFYAVLPEELNFVKQQSPRPTHQIILATLLKTFQNLGYFPALEDVPEIVITRIGLDFEVSISQLVSISNTTLYRYHNLVRDYLDVSPFRDGGRDIVIQIVTTAAKTMNDPADLINAAIEELIRLRFELPGYSHLDRLTAHLREQINQDWYRDIANRLTTEQKDFLDTLPALQDTATRTNFTLIKEPGKRPALREIRRIRDRLRWLVSLMDTKSILNSIPPARIRLFAGEARALEAGDIIRFSPSRRYTLLLCLLYEATIKTRDILVTLLIRRMNSLHKSAKKTVDELREQHRQLRENMVEWMGEIFKIALNAATENEFGQEAWTMIHQLGDIQELYDQIQSMKRYHGNNLLPFMRTGFARYRSLLFDIVDAVSIHSSTQDQRLIQALTLITSYRHQRASSLPADLNITFVSRAWQRLIEFKQGDEIHYDRRYLEIAIFSYLATELQTGDVYVDDSEEYGDLRRNLLTPEEYEPLIEPYCEQLGIPSTGRGFVEHLKEWLEAEAKRVDAMLIDDLEIYFDQGKPILRRLNKQDTIPGAELVKRELKSRLAEQPILDILAYANQLVGFTRHFGPLSGSDPKIQHPVYRYIMTVFAHGSNLGPSQTARHTTGDFYLSAMDISRTHSQHISIAKLDDAIRDVINFYNRFDLPFYWGSGRAAAADGTLIDIYNNNLLSAYHVRYGKYGGIAYHHVSDTYVALFSHFISVGTWEAIYILDGLLKNDTEIQPEMLHSDTQGQSLTVFGFAYLLGIQLMPRIRQWKDLTMYRPSADAQYQTIDDLFTATINWQLIQTHWKDLMQVILSIQAGRILPSTLLRKLNHKSRKNRLYRAFKELGNVVRTVFLLRYISDTAMRRQITVTTNKAENYNEFSDWVSFGGEILPVNDPVEQEKRIKYNDLISNCIILKNVVDMTQVLRRMHTEGYPVNTQTIARLSPYLTEHIRRFGSYSFEPDNIVVDPFDFDLPVNNDSDDTQNIDESIE